MLTEERVLRAAMVLFVLGVLLGSVRTVAAGGIFTVSAAAPSPTTEASPSTSPEPPAEQLSGGPVDASPAEGDADASPSPSPSPAPSPTIEVVRSERFAHLEQFTVTLTTTTTFARERAGIDLDVTTCNGRDEPMAIATAVGAWFRIVARDANGGEVAAFAYVSGGADDYVLDTGACFSFDVPAWSQSIVAGRWSQGTQPLAAPGAYTFALDWWGHEPDAPDYEPDTAAPTTRTASSSSVRIEGLSASLTTNRTTFASGEAVAFTLELCNNGDRPYEQPAFTSGVSVHDAGQSLVFDAALRNEAKRSWAPAECVRRTAAWDQSGPSGARVPPGRYRVSGGLAESQVQDGPRPPAPRTITGPEIELT